ncbi:type I-F CRISPR-associated helicase Cas3f [Erwinia pyrifoliae]|uniref:type I-F CRISPR-associated helicase Cas3f n=1 Tax=Erwinia pyrifoliae TaxID=79967 RepID=UPI00223B68DE|nr:type I-F CRISPR-associated helicase Cas3f [Erwinia pyrifoliae]MCT2387884.1 type I-F CRISPR-associated helicase Cas3f [Erwinia pyrifoliae]MCU8586140.1 type I-F CRISPR-associated helicase Cas3f [Erwinia pyrifoliae]
MNILLIAQCNKRALEDSRRILDQFAERKGDRSWQTAITQQGLLTLRKLLRKTARRNTAVACHWIKSNGQSELLWIVGNLRRFNAQGAVPTHTTSRDVLKSADENSWHSVEAVSLLAAIAGLFHDFGKANSLFQQMLVGKKGVKSFQPYRHEWVSLRLFCAWVAGRDDRAWIAALSDIGPQDEQAMLAGLQKDGLMPTKNPFDPLPPVARVVAWLILSHHRMPVYPKKDDLPPQMTWLPPELEHCDGWLTRELDALWNALNHHHDWKPAELQAQWQFPQGTPMQSGRWCGKARKMAQRLLAQPAWLAQIDINQRFSCHMARLALMLADHVYSAKAATPGWQDPDCLPYANTDSGRPKQRLDEHNIGVAQNALLLARSLPHLRKTLPAIARHKGFKKRSENSTFRWQDNAWQATCNLRDRAFQQGFFGINMASTGCGKTFANARIMYALSDEQKGCRFAVALGLRTLTLQTGDALREKLKLEQDDLAVLVGSQAVTQLHQQAKDSPTPHVPGSESAAPLPEENQYVSYDGSLDDGRLSRWLEGSAKLNKLLSAPVLVTTIDHLIGATEGLRGGRQIAPMLRLLTSDLVLDEPDDFDIDDLPALCRLVNWAGMLGSRVLLSSATLPPALVLALFNAYRSGREVFQHACGLPVDGNICCAWFDENAVLTEDLRLPQEFMQQHQEFVARRVSWLAKQPVLRRGWIAPVAPPARDDGTIYRHMAQVILQSMMTLHHAHHQRHPVSGKTISTGVIRLANINPLVAVAQQLLATGAAEDTHIHYCVYHSQHPLAMRSHFEQRLDATLDRHQPEAIWQVAEIANALEQHPQQHHLFVVLATAVAEVGRDHDYDWAIAEPSSMRSLIQLAGRVQRHRQQEAQSENIHMLQQNIRSLKARDSQKPAYCQPGFEHKAYMLASHDLQQILDKEQYQTISAIPRIQQRREAKKRQPFTNLTDLEHQRLMVELQGKQGEPNQYCAALWWREQASWCGEMQRRKPFRQSLPEDMHFMLIAEEGEQPEIWQPDDGPSGRKQSMMKYPDLTFAAGISAWIAPDYQQVWQQLADSLTMELEEVSLRFGEIVLRTKPESEEWHFHPLLGVFKAQ